MVDFIKTPFANAGDVTAIPEASQPSGVVSFTDGFGPDYELEIGVDAEAKAVPRDQTNWLFKLITEAIQQYQKFGFPDFITSAQNGGSPFPYAKDVVVRYSPDAGVNYYFYQSLISNNTSLPTVTANWQLYASENLAGQVAMFAGNAAPTGWLKADGTAVSRTTYAKLYAAIGVTYGAGDGSTTFNLPDLRGEFIRGFDDGRGVDPSRAFGSSQAEMIGPHAHFIAKNGTFSFSALTDENYLVQRYVATDSGYNLAGQATEPDVGLTSNGVGTENRPRNVALLACIRY